MALPKPGEYDSNKERSNAQGSILTQAQSDSWMRQLAQSNPQAVATLQQLQQLRQSGQQLTPQQQAAGDSAAKAAFNSAGMKQLFDANNSTAAKLALMASMAVLTAGIGGAVAAPAAGAAGSAAAAGTAAGGATASGLGLTGIAGGAVTGAASGAIGAALQGQNIGKGALIGGIGGAVGGALKPLASGVSSTVGGGTLGNVAGKAVTGAIGGGVSAAIGGRSVGAGLATGGVGGAISGLASSGASALGASAPVAGALGNIAGKFAGGAVGSQFSAGGSSGVQQPNMSTGSMGMSANGSNYLGAGAAGIGAGLLSGGGQGTSGNMAINPQTYGGSTDQTLAGTITGALPGLLQGAATGYGAQNAAEARTTADANAIATQQNSLGNINNIWSTQQQLGQGADTALGSALGTNGQPANYSNFMNMPGYRFAVSQGTQAIQRQAAAMGNAYTPNTAAAVGQYVTGTAAQDYNTYISQLMGAAGLGTTANQGLQTGQQNTADNISSLQNDQGVAQAAGISGVSSAVSGAFSPNGVGTSLIGAAGNYLFGNKGGASGGSSGGSSGGAGGGGGIGSIGTPVNTGNPFGGTILGQGNYSQYNAANGYTGGNGTFGSGLDTSTGQPWTTGVGSDNTFFTGSNVNDPSSYWNNMATPEMPSIDAGGDFGGSLGYGDTAGSGLDFLGGGW